MPPNNDNTLAQLKAYLQSAGLSWEVFGDLVDRSVRLNWTMEEFTLNLYGSREFKEMFPGIFRPDGSMRMSPSQYLNMVDTYRSTARSIGLNPNLIDKDQFGDLIRGDVSPQEFSDRLTAVKRISEFKPAFEEFKQVLRSRGISPKGIDTDEEMLDFMLGAGPKKFYQIWDELTVGTAARTAGVQLGQHQIRRIAKILPGQANEAQIAAGMQDLAKKIQTIMPLSKINKYGISKKDLVQLEFGGPNQAAIAKKVEMALGNYEAFKNNPNAHTAGPEFGSIMQDKAQV